MAALVKTAAETLVSAAGGALEGYTQQIAHE